MDVWIEFKHSSKWQAEALFRNFFPSIEDCDAEDGDITLDSSALDGISLPSPPLSTVSSTSSLPTHSRTSSAGTNTAPPAAVGKGTLGAKNTAYIPPPVDESIAAASHSAKPLDAATLAQLSKTFADAIPDHEFSVAALQGCELLLMDCMPAD